MKRCSIAKKMLVLLTGLLLLFTVSCGEKQEVNVQLLTNVSFESVTDSSPEDWTLDRYDSSLPADGCGVVDEPSAPDGSKVLVLVSTEENDVRYVQTVPVEKGAYYRFSAMVKTVEVTGQKEGGGAGLSVLGSFFTSEQISGTTDWTSLTVYGQADETGNIQLALRLGFYGNDQKGTAYFDNVSFVKVDKADIPDGVTVGSMEKYQSQSSAGQEQSNADVIVPVVLRGLLYLVLMMVLLLKGREWLSRMPKWGFVAILGAALLLRLIFSVSYRGFSVDVTDFALWGKKMATYGLGGFYEADYFCDYPPVYMLVLGLLHKIGEIFGLTLSEGGGLILLKLPAILCDLAGALLIYRLADKHLDRNWAYVLGTFYAFNPAAILDSALWGQVDRVLVLLLMATFVLLDEDRYGVALAVFFLALYTKPQAVLFGPVMLFATVCEFLRIGADFREKRIKEGKCRLLWGFGSFFGGVGVFLLFSLIMANGQPFGWLLDKYMNTLGSYQYAAVNVFNFMALIGGQWTPADNASFLGLSFGTLGTILTVLVLAYGALLMILHLRRTKGKVETASLWLYAALTMIGVVVFSTRSHERYLFPSIAFLLVAFIRTKDKRILWGSVASSILSFLNAAVVLYLYEETGRYMEKNDFLLITGSLFTVLLFVLVAVTAWDHATGRYRTDAAPLPAVRVSKESTKATAQKNGDKTSVVSGSKLDQLLSQRSFSLPKVSWKDLVICLAITASYAVMALSNLGDTSAPQTFWYGEETTMYTVADFGETVTADRLLYRTAADKTGFLRLEVSADGETYERIADCKWDETAGDRWYEADMQKACTFRYLRVTALSEDTELNELVVLNENVSVKPVSFTDKISPLDSLSGKGEALFDQPDSLPVASLATMSVLPETGLEPETTENATSTWKITSLADYALIDFGEITAVQRGYFYPGLIPDGIDLGVSYSYDGKTWSDVGDISQAQGKLYYWHGLPGDNQTYKETTARYVLVEMKTPGARLLEMGFFASADASAVIPVTSVTGADGRSTQNVSLAFDEQDLVPTAPSYMNSMYFDEIYHARTGYESANGLKIYEVSHPPLGKDFIAMSIETFGMTPFAWRFPGAVAGILMLPVLYFLGLLIFRKSIWATGLTLLMTLDGMHFAQTRIATIDSFAVLFILLMFLFMFWYQSLSFFDKPLWKTFIPLGLCGISFGLGVASKWIGVYAGAGLALLFFLTVYRRTKEYSLAKSRVSREKGETKEYLQHIVKTYRRNLWLTLLFCVAFFVVIPLVVYALSYLPYYNAEGETRPWLEVLVENQKYMYRYHSTLEATHPYQSDWYTWPVIYRPMWFYKGQQLPEGLSACISSFGNPAVWYTGLACTLIGIGVFAKRLMEKGMDVRFKFIPDHKKSRFERFFDPGDEAVADHGTRDMWTVLFLLVGIACNLGPWMGIGRCVFIYHYFATTPFIMIFTIWCLRDLCRRKPKLGGALLISLLLLALLLFLLFKPIWTGTPAPTEYIRTYLKWFDSWEFGVG